MKTIPCTRLALFHCLLMLLAQGSNAGDWPHWLGPNGDNIAPWEGAPPSDLNQWKVAWKSEVGLGYSSVTVADGRAYTLGHDGKGRETLYCFDAATGAERWKFSYDAELLPRMHPGGPNASPTVTGGRVLIVSKDGQVHCLTAEKGEVVWKASLTDVLGIKIPNWGFASSPVVDGGRVLLSAGKVAALDLKSGKTLWTSLHEYHPGYTTPVVFENGGKSFIAALDGKGLTVLSGPDGSEIARHPFKAQFDMLATTPIVLDEGRRIFISGNTSSDMLQFDGEKLEVAWTTRDLRNAMNNSVLMEGVLYGVDGKQQNARSRFVSMNAKDGTVNWVREDFGYGTTIGVGRSLLALTEAGELVMVQAKASGYEEISRRPVLAKTCWTNPVLAANRIYARNDQGQLVCLAAP